MSGISSILINTYQEHPLSDDFSNSNIQLQAAMKTTKMSFVGAGLSIILTTVPATSSPTVKSKHKVTHRDSKTISKTKPSVPLKFDSWKPDPALVNDLADEGQVNQYFIRLPLGYSEVIQSAAVAAQRPPGFDNHLYSINRRSDGTASTIGLTIATPPPDITGTLSLDDALEGTLARKKQQWQNFTESATESGQVSGLAFKRAYFKGIVSGAAGSRQAHGLVYVTEDGRSVISFEAEDVEPYNDYTLPIAQVAVLTFRRQSSK